MKTKYEKVYPHLCSLAVNDFFKSYKIVKSLLFFKEVEIGICIALKKIKDLIIVCLKMLS